MQTSTGGSNLNVNASRSLTRLKSVFVSLTKSLTGTSATTLLILAANHVGSKEWNGCFSHMFTAYDADLDQHSN